MSSMKCQICSKEGKRSVVFGIRADVCKEHHKEVSRRIAAINNFIDDLHETMLTRSIRGYLKDGRAFSILKRNSWKERNEELVDYMVYTAYAKG